MGVSPTGRSYGGGVITGGGNLRLPPPEYSQKVIYDQDNYGPVSGGEEASRITVGQEVLISGILDLEGTQTATW